MVGHRAWDRRGAVTVEAAIVYPVLLMLLLGIIIGGVGVFRYQQVACLAREAARRASVQGLGRQRELDQPSLTQQQLLDDVVLPAAVGMKPNRLTVSVQWVDGVSGQVLAWDAAKKDVLSLTAQGEPVANRVRVTVTYGWVPELFLAGPINLRSISEMPMAF